MWLDWSFSETSTEFFLVQTQILLFLCADTIRSLHTIRFTTSSSVFRLLNICYTYFNARAGVTAADDDFAVHCRVKCLCIRNLNGNFPAVVEWKNAFDDFVANSHALKSMDLLFHFGSKNIILCYT